MNRCTDVTCPLHRLDNLAALESFARLREGFAAAAQAFQEVARTAAPVLSGVSRAFARLVEHNHVSLWQLAPGPDGRQHRRRCGRCRPYGYHPPLPINGAEYARRRRARARRNRR